MSDDEASEFGREICDAEMQLGMRRARAEVATNLITQAKAVRNSSAMLCDMAVDWALCDDEREAIALFGHVESAWGAVKASYRLCGIAVSGA